MAGAPRAFVLLFGMGLRSFSMSPAFIPTIKELHAPSHPRGHRSDLRRALKLKTTAEVSRFLGDQINELAPNLKLLDTA